VKLENAPFDNVTLSIKVNHEDITNILIKPSELEFKPDVNLRYFIIEVPSDYDTEDRLDINLVFEVKG